LPPADGDPIKTVKATLLKALEDADSQWPVATVPTSAAWIAAILQATKTTTNITYSELASAVFTASL